MPPLTAEEQVLYKRLLSVRSKSKSLHLPGAQDQKIACSLVSKQHAAFEFPHNLDAPWFVGISKPKVSTVETPPDWIWLPNALVDGAADETPPLELVRQSGRAAALRLLVDLYAAQSLAENGGVHWRQLRQGFTREKVGERGEYIVWGFTLSNKTAWPNAPFVSPHLTGQSAELSDGKKQDTGWKIFWDALETLTLTGLVEFVEHVIDYDHDSGDHGSVVHPYAWSAGEPAERELGLAAHG